MATDSASEFTNSILVCVDCQEEFVFTASAQKYFAERGFMDPPKRCRSCYISFKNGGGGEEGGPSIPPAGFDGRPRSQLRGET